MMNLRHHFLIAMPTLDETCFGRAVIYICEHNSNGAMGLIINKPIVEFDTARLLDKMDINVHPYRREELARKHVFNGGPLSDERGFVIHSSQHMFDSSVQVSADVMVTTSKDVLSSFALASAAENTLIVLGYSGWTAGQLEQEILDNAWLTIEANHEILFNTPSHLCWQNAAKQLGIDIGTISLQAGHA